MIEYIKGELTECSPTQAVIEANGVGYDIQITLNTYSEIQHHASAKLYIKEIIREDAHLLYGFSNKTEREMFTVLCTVSGVGPNTSRTILSSLSPSELAQAILSNNEKAFTAVKGIGGKTAQRILLELKNKVTSIDLQPTDGQRNMQTINANTIDFGEEALSALLMLGYAKPAAQKAIATAAKRQMPTSVEQLIKDALRLV